MAVFTLVGSKILCRGKLQILFRTKFIVFVAKRREVLYNYIIRSASADIFIKAVR